jgi:hypothetical protein
MKIYKINSDAYTIWFIVSILTVKKTKLSETGRNLGPFLFDQFTNIYVKMNMA